MSKRFGLSILFGGVCTLSIFYFMATLISSDKSYMKDREDGEPIEFLRIHQDDTLETRNRRPPKQPEAEPPPKQPQLKVATPDTPSKPQMALDMPQISRSIDLNSASFSGGMAPAASGEVLPLVRIEPHYPQRARMSGIEGWVEVQFDVDKKGAVYNIQIIGAKPWKIFDTSARRAVARWKYRPRVINGKPTVQKNIRTRFEFKIDAGGDK